MQALGTDVLFCSGPCAQVKFNVNRVDNMVIQAIALLDTLDKDINTFVMRVREWYSWHFPELVKICADNYQYARLALFVKEKTSLTQDSLPGAPAAAAPDPAFLSFKHFLSPCKSL